MPVCLRSFVRPTSFRALCHTLLTTFLLCGIAYAQNEPTASVESLRNQIKQAAQLLKDSKISECTELIETSSKQLQELVRTAPPKSIADLKKLHGSLAKAHELLEIQGAELTPLPAWEELERNTDKGNNKTKKPSNDKPAKPDASETISFTKDIAPWMVAQCSRCHIDAARGGFSLATYEAIAKGSKGGVVVFPGDPVGSRLVESIETGDMPRGGGRVSPENLEKLKKWVTQGAKYDGANPADPIASLVTGAKPPTPTAPPKMETTVVKEATGKETVSFAKDIAPILIANCNGCHYAAMRASGGLQFNNFAQLLKGGDSGSIIVPGKPDNSLLMKKLLGLDGDRMPKGRPALSDENIKLISTWINEGAVFDGAGRETRLDSVVAQDWASKASHVDLMDRRIKLSREQWQIVAPKSTPDESRDEQFFVIGNIGEESTKKLLAQANTAAKQVRKTFKISDNQPLVKGGITIFALKQRYDYSEFGTMLEKRSLPSEWSSHWRRDVIESYVAIVYDKNDNKINESSLVQQIASLWIASQQGVPKWFADGVGRQTLVQTAGQNDARVQPWLRRMPQSMEQLKNVKQFLDGEFNDEDAATIGFGIVRFMHDSQMKKQYDAIIRTVASGTPFDKAFEKTIGPLDTFLATVLGKQKK